MCFRQISFVFLLQLAVMSLTDAEDSTVTTPRPVPATRPEMKRLLEDMKKRSLRITLPELSDADREALGTRSDNYEARLRYHFIPTAEGSVFGGGRPNNISQSASPGSRPDFRRNADENMSLTYQFKTMLFWIVSRTNNCQYCLGHQEWKLRATGMSDDAIAALDCDWRSYSADEQAAFGYARRLTFEPNTLSKTTMADVLKHYNPLQVLEMTMSVAGNNAINRWKEGTGIPQSDGNTFNRQSSSSESAAAHSDSFMTPTSEKFSTLISVVAPLHLVNGKPDGFGVAQRPTLESRDEVLEHLKALPKRIALLPMVDDSTAKDWLRASHVDAPVQNWMKLIATFPNEGRGRLPALISRERKTGELSELQKWQFNWIIARQDRAWYAIGQAYDKLKSLGQSDDQIFSLDGDWHEFGDADQALFQFARNLAASPIALTDENFSAALSMTGPSVVVQTVNHVASCAYFDRVTEAAGLPLEME